MASLSLGALSQCEGTPPAIKAKTYLGSSEVAGIVNGDGEVILCSDPRFDEFLARKIEDENKLLQTFVGCCAKWKSQCELTDALGLGEKD